MKRMLFVLGISAALFACGSGGGETPDVEKPADTPGTSGTAPSMVNERGLELIGSNDCTTCHAIEEKKIGPAYVEVAKKYENTPAVVDTLVSKIIHGGQGVWGTVPMTAHPDLSQDDAKEMVNYILSLKNQ